MLLKLLKYDFKYIFKIMIPCYVAGIIVTIFSSFTISSQDIWENNPLLDFYDVISDSIQGLHIFIMVAIPIITIIWCILYFYKHLFGQEGYLTNTLPVTHHQLLLSKTISIFTACVLTSVVLAFMTLVYNSIIFGEDIVYIIKMVIQSVFEFADLSEILIFINGLVVAMVSILAYMLIIFMSIAIAQFTKHRVIMSFVVYFIVQQFIVNPIFIGLVFIVAPSVGNIIGINESLICMTIFYSIIAVICYYITAYIMKNKLNLQ